MNIPTIETERLRLRAFELSDASEVQRLAGSKEIADTTLNIPHPYLDGMAEDWISRHQGTFESNKGVTFAITDRETGNLVGAIGLLGKAGAHQMEMGYWVGRPYWNKGYCTEAGRAIIDYAFSTLGLIRVHSCHISRNPASGKVMKKLGMSYEGLRKKHVKKGEIFEDLELYGILKKGQH